MLAKLVLELESKNQEISMFQSSNFQGVLMEYIHPNYGEYLHMPGLKPYSQWIEKNNQGLFWHIQTTNEEAKEQIIDRMNSVDFRCFSIKKKDTEIQIVHKTLEIRPKVDLLQEFYQDKDMNGYIDIEFMSPTAFKSQGEYIIYPDLRLLYQSLMNKYTEASSDIAMSDADTLEQLLQNSRIVQYRLRSVSFPMEKIRIPSFMGSITLKIQGNQTMKKFASMLFSFGEYSGVGIKTGMGMGAIRKK